MAKIVQALLDIQHRHGFLPQNELLALKEKLPAPLHQVQEVASFYPHFRLEEPRPVEVLVCHDMACHARGAAAIKDQLARKALEPQVAGNVEVKFVSCLGRCDRAPAACVKSIQTTADGRNAFEERLYVGKSLAELIKVVAAHLKHNPVPGDTDAALERHAAKPWLIDVYEPVHASERTTPPHSTAGQGGANPPPATHGYEAVRQFAARPIVYRADEKHPEKKQGEKKYPAAALDFISALKTSGLRGMGGAGVDAYKKWRDVLKARGDEKFIVCNGDESEPCTFKDRELLLRAPHLVLEGVILAGLVTGARQGYIYIRHEYREQIDLMNATIAQARRVGACGGSGVFGSSHAFDVAVFVSPGGYICGEQSALLEAMEDRRAQPRNKPPELQTNGYRDMPTLVSNVETFAWAPAIALRGTAWYNGQTSGHLQPLLGDDEQVDGGAWYSSQGANGCQGLRFFSVCGDVQRPGVYEVPNGITLRDFLRDHAGGVRGELKAIAPSGPSGGFLPARIPVKALPKSWRGKASQAAVAQADRTGGTHLDILDLELDLTRFRDLGLMLGAGLAVYNQQANIVEQALNCLEFFRQESCGKCVPCRIGSHKIAEIAGQLQQRQLTAAALASDSGLVKELAKTMEMTSICGLGVVAANPFTSLLRYFPAEVAAYTAANGPITSGHQVVDREST